MKKESVFAYKSFKKRRTFKQRAKVRRQRVKFEEENKKIRQNEAILPP